MSDFFEIDFLPVGTTTSGDAITMRYRKNGETKIHVVDGGYRETGDSVVEHIKDYYDNAETIDSVIVTHPDIDHTGGLITVLEEFEVEELWMLRPWEYADELIDRFKRYTSVENLKRELRKAYPNIATLEDIAEDKGIPIYEPFQGASIGAFTVLAPTKSRYLDLIVESDKTPEALGEAFSKAIGVMKRAISLVFSKWGEERLSSQGTSAENEMSVVQYALLCEKRILLTGDAGRGALSETIDYAPQAGLSLPGVDRFQVPHHGSRRNVSTEILDDILGPRLESEPSAGEETFTAIVSAAAKDEDHPRKAVVRAMIHRGGQVVTTKGITLCTHCNMPRRPGWGPVDPLPYPDEQEDVD